MRTGLRWGSFAMVALLLTAAAAGILATIQLPGHIVQRSLQSDVESRATVWLDRILQQFGGAEGFGAGPMPATEAAFLNLLIQTSDTYKVNLYATDGTVYWSSRPEDIGKTNAKPYFRDVIAAGGVYYAQVRKPLTEMGKMTSLRPDDLTAIERDVAEIYVPVVGPGGFRGAVEFYVDVTRQVDVLTTRLRLVIGAMSAAAIVALAAISIGLTLSSERTKKALRSRAGSDRRIMEEQVRLTREVRLLGELNEWLQSASSLEELFEMVGRFLAQMLPDCAGTIYVYSSARDMLDGRVSWNGGKLHNHIRRDECWGLRRGRTYTYAPEEINFSCSHAPHDDRPYFCFPIIAHGETVGLMHVEALEPVAMPEFRKVQKLAQMSAEQVSMAIANVRMRDQLQELSIRDPLTGLHNRRHFHEVIQRTEQDHRLAGTEFSLLAIDVDHFKRFNDEYGHEAGDQVLCTVGAALLSVCQRDEIVCRMGGEEFNVIMPDADLSAAEARANDIRRAVEQLRMRYGETVLQPVTVSVGYASYPLDGIRPDDLLRSADEALYAAKEAGRNRIRASRRLTRPEMSTGPEDVVALNRRVAIQSAPELASDAEDARAAGTATTPLAAEQPGNTGGSGTRASPD